MSRHGPQRLWLFSILMLLQAPMGCGQDQRSGSPEELFDEVWHELLVSYPCFDVKNVDWLEQRDQCRPIVEAPDATYEVWIDSAMDCLLAPLADWHLSVRDRDGEWHGYGQGSYSINYLVRLGPESLENGGTYAAGDLVLYGTTTVGGYGYMRLDTFDRASLDHLDFGGVLTDIGDVPGFIIDVRPNSGGSDRIARDLAGRFFDAPTIYAWVSYREESDGDETTFELGEPAPLEISSEFLAEDAPTYPVALLVGARCMSACESFVLMMENYDNIRTFGSQTRGSTGNPVETTLSDGSVLRHPTWRLTRADQHTLVEGTGIAPHVEVDFTGFPNDQVLEAALEWLQSQ